MPGPRLYLDTAAGRGLVPAARAVLERLLALPLGNPSSPHAEGRAAKDELEAARTQAAGLLGCRPREVIFTSGGTEAANLAVRGLARARAGVSRRVVLSAVEHPCVRLAAAALAADGFEVLTVPVDARGRVDGPTFAAAAEGAALAALMAANHESGTQQPVAEVAARLAALAPGVRPPLVVDAVLAAGRLPLAPLAAAADVLLLSGGKLGGPPGTGLLRVRRPLRLEPLLLGGLQEDRLRAGTENVPGLAAAVEALARALDEQPAAAARLAAFDAALLDALGSLPGWRRLGDPAAPLPGLVTLELDGVEGEAVMINLDLKGVAVATGSTCALGGTEPSPSLLAMGLSPRRAASTVRLSADPAHGPEDARRAAALLAEVVLRLRALAHRR